MSVARVASRYAKSLIDLAIEEGKLETVVQDVTAFQSAVKVRDFYLLLKSPIIKPAKKLSIFKEIFSGKFDVLTFSFIEIILRKGREVVLPEITDAFLDLYKKHKHVTSIVLRTAKTMSDDQMKAIRKQLEDSPVTENTVEIETVVDPSLLGGFIIELGDKRYDASVAHKLETLRRTFSDNEYLRQI